VSFVLLYHSSKQWVYESDTLDINRFLPPSRYALHKGDVVDIVLVVTCYLAFPEHRHSVMDISPLCLSTVSTAKNIVSILVDMVLQCSLNSFVMHNVEI